MRSGGSSTKKEASCDPLDPLDRLRGDDWDHTAVDPESRLLLALVPGKRDGATCERLIRQVHDRTGGRTDLLLTSDEHAPYETAIREVYGVEHAPAEASGAGPPAQAGEGRPRRTCATRRCGSGARRAGWWRWCGPWSSARCTCWAAC